MMLRVSSLVAMLLLAPGALDAQVVLGRVLDAVSGAPIPQAVVAAATEDGRVLGRARSGADGSFSLALRSANRLRLRAERAGLQPSVSQQFDLGVRDTLEVELRMSGRPLEVEPLIVRGRRQPREVPALAARGFYEREARGFGRFLRRSDIERFSNRDIVQVIDRLPGTTRVDKVVVFDRSGTDGMIYRTQKRGSASLCLPRVYLDGSNMIYTRGGLEEMILPEHVEAIEVYSSPASIPAEFTSGDASCGVIVIWTRASP